LRGGTQAAFGLVTDWA